MSLNINPADGHKCCLYSAKRKPKVFQLFSHHLIEYIHDSSDEELQNFLHNPECLEVIQEYCYEVLEILVMILNEDHQINKKKINSACGKVIVFMATHCHANELILYIVEQIELSIIKSHFQILFHSLQLCLLRCKNPLKMLDMCVDAITKFLVNLPLPHHEFSKDRNDDIVEDIVLSYTYIIDFIDNIYKDTQSFHDTSEKNIASDLKQSIFKLIISCFGNTFNHMDISNEICNVIFQKVFDILYAEIDLIYLIHLKNNINTEIFSSCETKELVKKDCSFKFNHYYPFTNMNYVQLCNLSWLIFYSEKKSDFIPCVYNPIYIIFCIIQLSNNVIHEIQNQNIIISRVLNLVNFALNINQLSIPMECIDTIVHDKFMKNIMDLVISSESIKVQKYVINSFIQYINKYDVKAKYRILQKLIVSKCHVKIIGMIIGMFKDTIAQSHFNESIDDKERLFFDNSFQDFISKICCLKSGTDTDLIEMSDQLIPTLNFIIFYVIRKKDNNEVVQLLSASDYEFLKLLNKLVQVQLNEWKRFLDYLNGDHSENQQCIDNLQPSMKTMSVMPKDQQIFMCHQATNTLFIIQNLTRRICELINYTALEDCNIESTTTQ